MDRLLLVITQVTVFSANHIFTYRRIPKVTAPITFGFWRQKGPLLSGSRYFRIGKKRLSLEVVLDKEDTYYEI